jgi:hypothetical protein
VAASLVAVPAELVNTARISQPFSKALTTPLVKLVDVNPGTFAQVDPPFTDSCHCTDGVGVPLADAEKVTVLPEYTVWLIGWVVTTGLVAGVTTLELADANPGPAVLAAATVNEYWSPLVSPVTVSGLTSPVFVWPPWPGVLRSVAVTV